MEFLKLLEGIRTPLLDRIALLVTQFGDETLLLLVALILFWCIDKKHGYRMMAAAFAVIGTGMLFKSLLMVPRPWQLDETFHAVEAALSRAQDYSFPSLHSGISSCLFGMLALRAKKPVSKVLFVICAVLVAFSRMYLGVHTPLDVSVGMLLGFGFAFLFNWLMRRTEGNMKHALTVQCVILALLIISAIVQALKPVSESSVVEFDTNCLNDTCSLIGAMLAMIICWQLDTRYIRFPENAKLWQHVVKVAVGLLLILGIRVALKAILPAGPFSNAFRYCMMLLFGAAVWPWCFTRWLTREQKA